MIISFDDFAGFCSYVISTLFFLSGLLISMKYLNNIVVLRHKLFLETKNVNFSIQREGSDSKAKRCILCLSQS